MIKYYTRACNFYYGPTSLENVNKNKSLPLNGNKLISFDTIELISRKNKKLIKIKDIKKLSSPIKNKIFRDLKQITKIKSIKKIKLKKSPLLMGILNATPDSFSDGGKFIKSKPAYNQIKKLIYDGADIIDIGGESTRPNSDTVENIIEWNRVKSKIKYAKKNRIPIPRIFLLLTAICHTQPIRLLRNLEEDQRPIRLLLDLKPKQPSFGGVHGIEPLRFMSDRFVVWSKIVQCNERSEKSSILARSFFSVDQAAD